MKSVIDNDKMVRLVSAKAWDELLRCVSTGAWHPNTPLVYTPTGDHFMLLEVAAEHGIVALAKKLIELGADVDAAFRKGETPLKIACGGGHPEIVDMLLEAGANVNAKTGRTDEGDRGETSLMNAAVFGHTKIVQKLIRSGAYVTASTGKGLTALSYALRRRDNDKELVRTLLEAGCPVDGRDLHLPVYRHNLPIVELLLSKKPDVNKPYDWPGREVKKGDTPLLVAVGDNALELKPARIAAAKLERLAIVDLLIEAGADVNAQPDKKHWTPLILAVAGDKDEIAKRLIAAGADPNHEIECSRYTMVQGRYKRLIGPLSAIGMARERPDNKNIRKLLLGSE